MFGVFPLLGARPWDELLPAAISLLLKISACERGLSKEELDSDADESFSTESGLLEYPQYTRPAEFRGWQVPEVLLSGDHEKVEKWRREQALLETAGKRPDLLEKKS